MKQDKDTTLKQKSVKRIGIYIRIPYDFIGFCINWSMFIIRQNRCIGI